MCGIAGIFHYADGAPATAEPLRAMTGAQRHRGPDAEGYHLDGPFGLGHARLSIIDVAGGDQPLLSEDGAVALVCNGEIYNFQQLRRELEARGHRFRTRSDCEVIVHLWEDEGERCVERLRGMFAFALADRRRGVLLLARDRMGKKPLYVADDGARVGFASELKALVAGGLVASAVDPEAVLLYLTYGYVPGPWSILRGAVKLPAGHLALVDAAGVHVRPYWELRMDAGEEASDASWTERLESTLGDAVQARLVSEVPLGAFLSGGIDSGTVVAMMASRLDQPVRTHTVGFADPELDERADAAAAAAALGTDHEAGEAVPQLADDLPRIAWHLDEPFADPSAVPTWYLCREARRRVTVALSGDGGDELFAGYPGRYGVHLWEERARRVLPGALRRSLLPPLARRWPRSPRLPRPLRAATILANLAVDAPRAYFHDRHHVAPDLQQRLLGPELLGLRRRFDPFVALEPHLRRAPAGDPLARVLYLDLRTWLVDDGLVKVDRLSMAHGLEVRCPLLDQEVVELAARMPSRLKLHRGETKVALRRVAARHLPPQLLRRPKRGFAPPVSRWLAGELHDLARATLLDGQALAATLFRRAAVATLLDDHRAGRRDAGWSLWTLLMLESWWQAAREAGRAGVEVRLAAGA